MRVTTSGHAWCRRRWFLSLWLPPGASGSFPGLITSTMFSNAPSGMEYFGPCPVFASFVLHFLHSFVAASFLLFVPAFLCFGRWFPLQDGSPRGCRRPSSQCLLRRGSSFSGTCGGILACGVRSSSSPVSLPPASLPGMHVVTQAAGMHALRLSTRCCSPSHISPSPSGSTQSNLVPVAQRRWRGGFWCVDGVFRDPRARG